jgi:hypothetical protein
MAQDRSIAKSAIEREGHNVGFNKKNDRLFTSGSIILLYFFCFLVFLMGILKIIIDKWTIITTI